MHQQQGGWRGGGLVILLVASCNNNQDKLQPDKQLSSIADLNLYCGIRLFLGTAKCFFDPSHPCINMYILHIAPILFLLYWQGEFVWKSWASLVCNHFPYSHDFNIWCNSDAVMRIRSQSLLGVRGLMRIILSLFCMIIC